MSVMRVAVSGKFTALDILDFFIHRLRRFICISLQSVDARLDTLNTGLLKYAVFFCAKLESVYIQKELF